LSSHASLDTRGDKKNRPLCPLSVVERALDRARRELFDTVIIDTAGRLQIDTDLMAELGTIAKATKPVATILIIDAMAGQEGLGVAQGFHARTPLTGVIVTKADGDARGGVMLSCRTVLDLPIHFLGMGERPDALEPFHPDRVASRILDLGDLASLAEQVAAATDDETQVERVKRLAQGRLTLEDFRSQLKEMGKLGSMEGLLKMLPGAGRLMPKIDMGRISSDLQRKEAIIDSMTLQERAQFRLLNGSRRQRIARGSGTTVTDVNRLIKEFEMMQKMIKRGGKGRKRGAGLPPELMQLMGK
jgi:signal recognition particle subunit SRP54